MKHRTWLNCFICASALMAGTMSADAFNSPEGKFSAEFPRAPSQTRTQGVTTKGTKFDEYRWSALNKDGDWVVAMFAYAKSRKADYEAQISAAVGAAKGVLVNQKQIQQSGVEGREILIDGPKADVVRERMFWIDGRLYFVIFSSAKRARANSPEVDKFLNSFSATE